MLIQVINYLYYAKINFIQVRWVLFTWFATVHMFKLSKMEEGWATQSHFTPYSVLRKWNRELFMMSPLRYLVHKPIKIGRQPTIAEQVGNFELSDRPSVWEPSSRVHLTRELYLYITFHVLYWTESWNFSTSIYLKSSPYLPL